MLPSAFHDRNVCIIGLGYVGLTLAVAMADVGFRVHGVEREKDVLMRLQAGKAHFFEIGLDVKLSENFERGRLTFSSEIDAKFHATVYIVTVGNPVGANKRTKVEAITRVCEALAAAIQEGDLVILRSTVRVGTTREIVEPILRKSGKSFDLAFCPERTLEGKALTELRTLPQIVGGLNDAATFRASRMFSLLTPSVIRVRDPETAELVKLVNNTQRDVTFAFANEVAAICDAIGVSAAEVIQSGNIGYPRSNLPLPGPVGGPCLEKDPYILAEGLQRYGFTPTLTLSARKLNEDLPRWTIEALAREFSRLSKTPPVRIAILGLAFKGRPATNDLRGSVVVPIIQQLQREFPSAEIVGWDPLVTADEVSGLGIRNSRSLEDAFKDSDIVVIQNNHSVFEAMNLHVLSSVMRSPGIIYDFWNQHDPREANLAAGVCYRALGASNLAKHYVELS